MARPLTPWLHSQLKDELALGHNWLLSKNTAKARASKPCADAGSKWRGLYHDNGSCIDILVPFASEHARVLVLQTSPLAITDGLHSTDALLTTACLDDLRARYPGRAVAVGTAWTVRKFTIRYTSYGPPRHKLRLLLDALDLVDIRPPQLLLDAHALNRSDDIALSLLHMHNARLQDDRRCLRLRPKEDYAHTMAGARQSCDDDASLDTQLPFGTQMQQETEISFLGTNQLEPVLAGNTQRAELKPRSRTSADDQRKQAQLLSLLMSKPQGPPPTRLHSSHATSVPDRSSPKPEPRPSKEIPAQSPREKEPESPSVQPRPTTASKDRLVPDCPWMKGLTLNRATTTVPTDQLYILNKPESFAKRPDFPDPNVPIKLFVEWTRMTDEKAALEGATSSGSFHESPSSASYPANSAPQPAEQDSAEGEAATSPVSNSAPQPAEQDSESGEAATSPVSNSAPQPTEQDSAEAATSPVSWKTSPSPAPPPLPSTLPASPHDHHHLPPSSPPAQLAALDSDNDMELETSVPQALGEDLPEAPPLTHPSRAQARSTSVVQVKEMPHIKGKNTQHPVIISHPSIISYPSQISKMENSSSASMVCGTYQDLSSNDTNHHLTHDAQDTTMFDMFVHDPSPDPAVQHHSERNHKPLHSETLQVQAQPEQTPMSAQLPPKDSSSGEQPAIAPHTMPDPPQPGSPHSRQPSDTSSLAKRKRQASPHDRRRGSRHKRPKHAFGGLDVKTLQRKRKEQERQKSTSVDSRQDSVSNVSARTDDAGTEDLDSKQSVQEQVDVSARTDDAGTQDLDSKESVQVQQVAGGMSPRHQSLYATPSPVLRPAPAAAVDHLDIDQSGQDMPVDQTTPALAQSELVSNPQLESTESDVSKPQWESTESDVSKPQLESTESEPIPAPPLSIPQPGPRPEAPDHNPPAPLTIFQKFQAAYPEYKANIKHFTNQCKQIEELDREDRMVPKWMWDDFIIRNRTDFAEYAASCIDAGEEPIKYITFYKDTIRDAVYKKGIIGTRHVLLQALQELGIHPRTTKPAAHSKPPPVVEITSPKKKSRKSLPFAVPQPPQTQPTNTRHSLPARPSASTSTHKPHRPSSTQHLPRLANSLRFYAAPSASPLETGSGNEYRDFLKRRSAQRPPGAGSGRAVNARNSAANGRDSVSRAVNAQDTGGLLRERNIDVLEWGDEL